MPSGLTPRGKLGSHVAGGLLETQVDVITVTESQLMARHLPLGRHHVSVCWRHGQHTIGRSLVSEGDLLATDGLVAYEVIDAGSARSVGLELSVLPRLAVIPLGEGHARHIGEPVAHNLLFTRRINRAYRMYLSSEVEDYTDEGETALCPYCGVDSVIGDASGFQLSEGFLQSMHKRWM